MSKKINPAAVGIFVVGALVILLAGLILLGAGEMFEVKKRFVVYFNSSTNGLDVGSDVLLGGVKVGSVQKMMIQLENRVEEEGKKATDESTEPVRSQKIIGVVIELSANRIAAIGATEDYSADTILTPEVMTDMIERGLRARLKSKSVLTGQLYVDLDFFPEDPEFDYTFKGKPGPKLAGLQQIPSTKNEIERVVETIAASLEKLSGRDIGTQLDELVAKVDGAVESAKTLFDDINTKIAELDLKGISDKTNSTLAKVDDLLGDEKIKNTIASIDEAARELKDLLAAIDAEAVNGAVVGAEETIEEAGDAIKAAGDALKKIELAAGNIAENTGSDAALTVRLNRTLGSIEEVSRSIKDLTDYLKRNPNSILAGKKRP